jgi:hypothetical protein
MIAKSAIKSVMLISFFNWNDTGTPFVAANARICGWFEA